MIAQFDPQSRKIVFGGCRTITGCDFVLRPGKAGPTGLPLWDFIIYRDDGKAIAFHPEYKKNKCPATQLDRLTPSGPTPRMRFKEYRAALGSTVLRFDPTRKPPSMAAAA